MPRPELSLVIPIYNEEEVLPQLEARLRELLAALALDTEVVFVNDGSKDRSIELLREMARREPRYRVASFSRNFGHQRAITCGMDLTAGKAVVVMDADLQDPPEVILEMVKKWREGYDVVYGRRRSRAGETKFKLLTAKVFYRLFAAMIPIEVPLDAGDFRLMSRRVVLTMRELRETHRFIRGMVSWVGFKQTAVEYDRAARAAGETKYPLKKMLAFAFDGIASFSILPLRAATYMGVLVGLFSVIYGVASVIAFLAGKTVPGWTTIVVLVSFLFAVQLVVTGVLGEYVGKIYEQVKGRPLYVVAEKINFKRRSANKPRRKRQNTGERLTVPGQIPAAALALSRPPVVAPGDGPGVTPVTPDTPVTPPAAEPEVENLTTSDLGDMITVAAVVREIESTRKAGPPVPNAPPKAPPKAPPRMPSKAPPAPPSSRPSTRPSSRPTAPSDPPSPAAKKPPEGAE